MASVSSSVDASAAAIANGGCSTDGPVLNVISKRLRALRKKYNRILQMEENVAQGKPLNKEQEEVLRSKPAVTLLIDEYEKLRQPLASALQEELSCLPTPPPASSESPATTAEHEVPDALDGSEVLADEAVGDLVKLLYFALLFDVKQEGEFKDIMVMRNHERDRCLTYDYVTDDATDLLRDADLDAISHLGTSITSRPANSGDSHRSRLEGCVQHAKLWLQNADQPIQPGASVTYAGLRDKLNKILASDYFTSESGMKSAADVAAVVGKFGVTCQVQILDGIPTSSPTAEEGVAVPVIYQHEDNEQQDVHVSNVLPEHELNPVDEPPKMVVLDAAEDVPSAEQEHQNLEGEAAGNYQRDLEQDDQRYTNRRTYQNYRGGNRGGVGNGGRRGYSNGRGGRGGRGGNGGGYQNGRNQFYDSGHYSRNYYNSRGRGGHGGSGMYGVNQGGTHGGYAPARVELNTGS